MKKVICSILAVVMALTVFMSQSFAKERNDVNNKLIIPSFMESEELQASGIVKNLNEYDDDKNVVGFLNNDGSKTVYIYGTDVKYIDENGKLQYKDISSINIETLTDDYSSNATINASCITDATVYSNQASTTHGTGI